MGLYYDGGFDYVNVADVASLQLTGSMSLVAWVKFPAVTAYGAFLSKLGSGALNERAYELPYGNTGIPLVYISSDGSDLISRWATSECDDDSLHCIIGVYNATSQTLLMYVDSILENGALGGVVPAAQFSNNGEDVTLATRAVEKGNSGTSKLDGIIYEARIYSRALALAEIESIYHARGSDNIVDNLVARWPMNEKTDGIAAAGANTVIDVSKEGNHGTPISNPVYRQGPWKLIRPPLSTGIKTL